MQAYITGSAIVKNGWPKNNCFVLLFAGDNFNVNYSFNKIYSDFKEESLVDVREFIRQIKERRSEFDSVLLTGGEPCLQRQALIDVSKEAKKLDLKVGIETNGSKPLALKSLLEEGLLDFIALDIKTPLKPNVFDKVTKSSTFFITAKQIVDDIKETLKLLKKYQNEIDIEIRTTVVPGVMYKKEDLLEIASVVKDLECRWIIQQFKPFEDKKFANVNSPTKKFLENLRRTCLKKYSNLRIEVFTDNRDYYAIASE